jgi:predicted MFS family arabinose efflux permease
VALEDKASPVKLRAGIKRLWGDRSIRWLLIAGVVWNLAVFAFPLVIVFLKDGIGLDATQSAIVLAAGGFGSFASAFVVQRYRANPHLLIPYALMVEGAMFIILGYSESVLLASVSYFVLMLCNTTIAASLIASRSLFTDPSRQALTVAVGQSSQRAGYMVTKYSGAGVLAVAGFSLTFLFSGLITVVAALCLLPVLRSLNVHETLIEEKRLNR